MLGKVLGTEREVVTGGFGQLHHEKLHSSSRLGASYHPTVGAHSPKRHGRHKKFLCNLCEEKSGETF
jgi:hypothetical protein